MPKYTYDCNSCEAEFEISHSIKEKLEQCELCGVSDTLQKVPVIPLFLSKNNKKEVRNAKPGSVVEEYIEENRKQLKQEKERLKKVKY